MGGRSTAVTKSRGPRSSPERLYIGRDPFNVNLMENRFVSQFHQKYPSGIDFAARLFNPAVHSCEIDEDVVGRMSRPSGRTDCGVMEASVSVLCFFLVK